MSKTKEEFAELLMKATSAQTSEGMFRYREQAEQEYAALLERVAELERERTEFPWHSPKNPPPFRALDDDSPTEPIWTIRHSGVEPYLDRVVRWWGNVALGRNPWGWVDMVLPLASPTYDPVKLMPTLLPRIEAAPNHKLYLPKNFNP